jgi:Methane oxygenase PmoA
VPVPFTTRREFLAATALGIGVRMQTRPYQLKSIAAGKVLEAPDGRATLTYLTAKPEGSNLRANSACCFHPVTAPSGERVTDLAPGDHVHHRGIFLAWHSMEFRRKADFSKLGPLGPTHGSDISRADFWGWGEFAPTDQRVIQNRTVALDNASDKSADLLIENDWTIRGDKYLGEKTTATWRETGDANVLDVSYALTPDWDLTINQQPFGGFCVRARNDGESWYEGPSGSVTLPDPHYSAADLNWPAADWYAYAIKLKSGKTVGCAVIDHASNPRSTWHNPRYVWMVNPCIVSAEPLNLVKGRTLLLRYRVVMFDGPVPVPLIRKLSSEWRRA